MFLAPMWLTNASSRGYNTLFWAPWHLNTHVYMDTYTYIHIICIWDSGLTGPGATFHASSDITKAAMCLQEHKAREAGTHKRQRTALGMPGGCRWLVHAKPKYY